MNVNVSIDQLIETKLYLTKHFKLSNFTLKLPKFSIIKKYLNKIFDILEPEKIGNKINLEN